MEAASSGNVDAAVLLLNAGAAINAKAESGKTALWVAEVDHQTQMAEFLRKRGAKDGYVDPRALLPFLWIIAFGGLAYLFWWAAPAPKPAIRPIHVILWIVAMVVTHPWTYKTAANPLATTIVIGAIAAYSLLKFVK